MHSCCSTYIYICVPMGPAKLALQLPHSNFRLLTSNFANLGGEKPAPNTWASQAAIVVVVVLARASYIVWNTRGNSALTFLATNRRLLRVHSSNFRHAIYDVHLWSTKPRCNWVQCAYTYTHIHAYIFYVYGCTHIYLHLLVCACVASIYTCMH